MRSDIEKSQKELKTKEENYKNNVKKAQNSIIESLFGDLRKRFGKPFEEQIGKYLNFDKDFKGRVEIHQYNSISKKK